MGDYNNGKPIEVPTGEEKGLAISEWAEGNIHLENALSSCIENGISTFASCAGHPQKDFPYLSLVITKENLGKILNMMSLFVQKGKLLNSMNLSPNMLPGQSGHILTMRLKKWRKNEGFDLISEAAAQEPIKLEESDSLVQEMWKVYKVLCQNCEGMYNAEYYNELIIKRFNMQYNTLEANGQALFEKMNLLGVKKERYMVGSLGNRSFNVRALDTETLAQKMSIINDELMIQPITPTQRSFEEEIKADTTFDSKILETFDSMKNNYQGHSSNQFDDLGTEVTDDSDDLDL